MSFWSKLFGSSDGSGGVKFVRKEQKPGILGRINTYDIYRAKTVQEAKVFLTNKSVTEALYYVVVETPDGNWAKDKDGVYKE